MCEPSERTNKKKKKKKNKKQSDWNIKLESEFLSLSRELSNWAIGDMETIPFLLLLQLFLISFENGWHFGLLKKKTLKSCIIDRSTRHNRERTFQLPRLQ